MTPLQALVLLTIWALSALTALYVCVRLGKSRGRSGLGWGLGLTLGWLGALILALFVGKTREQKVADAAERLSIEEDARRVAAGQPPLTRQPRPVHVHHWKRQRDGRAEVCTMCLEQRPLAAS